MDKKTKGILLLGAAAVAFIAYKRWSKKVRQQIEEQERIENEELESLGVSTEKLDEEIDPEDDKNNLVKAIAVSSLFNPEWDYELINPETALKTVQPIISVSQETFNVKGTEVTDLVFYLDIPNYTVSDDWKKPRLIDYMNGLKAAAEHAWSDIVRFCPRPRCWLVGMVVVNYRDEEGLLTSERVELDDPTVYESLKDETKKDGFGLGAMYEGFQNKTLPDEVNTKLVDWINKKWDKPLPEFEFIEFHLAYRIAFNMQTGNTALGINLKTGLETLDYLLNNVEIKRGGLVSEDDVKNPLYQHTLFCAPSGRYKTRHDLCYYYYVDSNNNLDIDCFSY